MQLTLIRDHVTSEYTTGMLYIDGKHQCYTLEDAVREIKIPKKTAIPEGRYKVILTHSARFQRTLPLLVDVPGFQGVRIHSGNTVNDTEGCILVGTYRASESTLGSSRLAFSTLFDLLMSASTKHEPIMLSIKRKA